MDNRYLVDWISFTTKIDSVDSIINAIGLSHLEFMPMLGFYGYKDRLYFEGISIHFNGFRDDMGVLVEMSGKGCRTYTTYNTIRGFDALFDLILDNEYNCTRLDVAYDDFNNIIPLSELADDVRNRNHISRFDNFEIIESIKSKYTSLTVNLGSKSSDIMFRFYDKFEEQRSKGNTDMQCATWVRAEMQLRRDRAINFIKLYNGSNLGDLFCGVLLNYYRVIIPNTNAVPSRCTIKKYWLNLIKLAVKVKLFTSVETEYTVHRLDNYVLKQAGGAISTLFKIKGKEQVLNDIENTPRVENPKYKFLIEEHKNYTRITERNISVNATTSHSWDAVKKVRSEYPTFVVADQLLEQLEFNCSDCIVDIDILSDDYINAYKPYHYDSEVIICV